MPIRRRHEQRGFPEGGFAIDRSACGYEHIDDRRAASGWRWYHARRQSTALAGLTSTQDGVEVTWPRIDDAARDEIKTKLAARIQSKAPVPGSDAALCRLIEGIREGTPNYDEMSPALAQACRRQLPQLQMTARFGAIQSIEFHGVGSQGWDVYEVRRENGVVKWRIALTDGVIVGAAAQFSDGP